MPSVYAYSRAKGLFAGIALDNAGLIIDKGTNAKVYGASVDAKQILSGSVPSNPTVMPVMTALEKIAPKRRTTTD